MTTFTTKSMSNASKMGETSKGLSCSTSMASAGSLLFNTFRFAAGDGRGEYVGKERNEDYTGSTCTGNGYTVSVKSREEVNATWLS